jgi:hypothetical protein
MFKYCAFSHIVFLQLKLISLENKETAHRLSYALHLLKIQKKKPLIIFLVLLKKELI